MEINNQYLFNMFNFKREVICYFNVCIFHTIKKCKIIERPWGHSLCTLVYEMHALQDNPGDSTAPKIFRNLGSLIPWRLTWNKWGIISDCPLSMTNRGQWITQQRLILIRVCPLWYHLIGKECIDPFGK